MADARPGVDPPPPFRLVRYEVLGSTNDEAKALAAAGAAEGTLVWALSQTKGRGRLDRNWVSPPGNLYLSCILRPAVPVSRAPEIGFAAALAVAACIDSFVEPSVAVTLKWPNDVLARGAKIAGILLEAQSAGSGIDWLVLGIGVNVASHPADTPYPATCLAALGRAAPDLGDVIARLAAALSGELARWRAGGFAAIREAWLGRAEGLGRTLELRQAGTPVKGIFRDLDPTGALVLETRSGARRVTAGDVHFGGS
jgi:BirA family biotin operon repressor/biotin-[acetyl-CoA-carboxylase] ligase